MKDEPFTPAELDALRLKLFEPDGVKLSAPTFERLLAAARRAEEAEREFAARDAQPEPTDEELRDREREAALTGFKNAAADGADSNESAKAAFASGRRFLFHHGRAFERGLAVTDSSRAAAFLRAHVEAVGAALGLAANYETNQEWLGQYRAAAQALAEVMNNG